MADEPGEHGGQAEASSVQHDGGGGPPDGHFGAAVLREASGGKDTDQGWTLRHKMLLQTLCWRL